MASNHYVVRSYKTNRNHVIMSGGVERVTASRSSLVPNRVDIATKSCDCMKYNQTGIPCMHVARGLYIYNILYLYEIINH